VEDAAFLVASFAFEVAFFVEEEAFFAASFAFEVTLFAVDFALFLATVTANLAAIDLLKPAFSRPDLPAFAIFATVFKPAA
jgi:hypothetical protein